MVGPRAAAGLPPTGADQHSIQPRAESIRIAERRQVPPRRHQGLLCRVRRAVGIAEDQMGEAVEAPDLDADEIVERIPIACHRPFHERPIHSVSILRERPLDTIGSGTDEIVPESSPIAGSSSSPRCRHRVDLRTASFDGAAS